MQIKILLVEDQKLMRIGIKSLFCDYPELEIIAEASSGKEAIEKSKLNKPDIVLMDLGLPDISGVDATKQILEYNNNIRVIILTSHTTEEEVTAALQAGASAYVIKDIATEILMSVIKMIKAGAMWLDPHIVPFIRDKNLYYKDFGIRLCNFIIKDLQTNRHTIYRSMPDEFINETIDDYKHFIKQYNEWYDNGKTGLLGKTYRDTVPDVVVRHPDFLIENQQYFMDTYGVNILDLDKKKQNKIAKILEKGKIKTDNEFRMINEYVDELCQSDGNQEMIDKLNILLADYEDFVASKLSKRKI